MQQGLHPRGEGARPAQNHVMDLLKPLIALAPEFDARVASGGSIGLSGLLAEQVDAAMTVYAERFKMDPPVLRGEWAFLSGRKRS